MAPIVTVALASGAVPIGPLDAFDTAPFVAFDRIATQFVFDGLQNAAFLH